MELKSLSKDDQIEVLYHKQIRERHPVNVNDVNKNRCQPKKLRKGLKEKCQKRRRGGGVFNVFDLNTDSDSSSQSLEILPGSNTSNVVVGHTIAKIPAAERYAITSKRC